MVTAVVSGCSRMRGDLAERVVGAQRKSVGSPASESSKQHGPSITLGRGRAPARPRRIERLSCQVAWRPESGSRSRRADQTRCQFTRFSGAAGVAVRVGGGRQEGRSLWRNRDGGEGKRYWDTCVRYGLRPAAAGNAGGPGAEISRNLLTPTGDADRQLNCRKRGRKPELFPPASRWHG
jgi:hypothetical protein